MASGKKINTNQLQCQSRADPSTSPSSLSRSHVRLPRMWIRTFTESRSWVRQLGDVAVFLSIVTIATIECSFLGSAIVSLYALQ